DEDELLAVALGVGPNLLRRVKGEAIDEDVAVGGVDPAEDVAEEVQRLGAGERGPEVHIAGDEGQRAVGGDGIGLAVDAEDLRPAGRGPDEPEQQPDRRGLAGAVGPEIAEDLTARHLEIEL